MVRTRAQCAQADAAESSVQSTPHPSAAALAEKHVSHRKSNRRSRSFARLTALGSMPAATDSAESSPSDFLSPSRQCTRPTKRRGKKLDQAEESRPSSSHIPSESLSVKHLQNFERRHEETTQRGAQRKTSTKTLRALSVASNTSGKFPSKSESFGTTEDKQGTGSMPASAFDCMSDSFLPCVKGCLRGSAKPSSAFRTSQNQMESKNLKASNRKDGHVWDDNTGVADASEALLPTRSSRACRTKQSGFPTSGDTSDAKARLQKRQRVGQLVLAYWCYASLYLTRKPFASARGTLQEKLSLSTEAMGWIDTAFLVAYAFTQLFVAPTISAAFRGRMNKFFLQSFLCSSACCLYIALAPGHMLGLQQLLVMWGLNGVAQALVFPFLVAILQQWLAQLPGGGIGIFGLWSTCQQVGSMAASCVTGAILALSSTEGKQSAHILFGGRLSPEAAWRSAFFVPAVIVCASGFVLYALLIESPEDQLPQKTGDAAVFPRPKRGSQDRYARSTHTKGANNSLLIKAGIPLLSGAYFCMKLVRYALINWLPLLLETQFRYDALETTLGATLFEVGGVAGAISVGYISQRFFNGRCFGVISLLCALATTASWCLRRVLTTGSRESKSLSTIGAGTPLWEQLVLVVLGASVAGPDSVLGGMAAASAIEHTDVPAEHAWSRTEALKGEKAAYRDYRKRLIATASCVVNGSGSFGSVLQGPLTPLVISAYGWQGFLAWLGCMCAFSGLLLSPLVLRDARKVLRDKCQGYVLGKSESSYTERDCVLYALGVGCSQDPLDESDLRYTYENHSDGFNVLPTFATTFPTFDMIFEGLQKCPGLPDFNPMMLLHGQHKLQLFRPLGERGQAMSHTGILRDVLDKKSGALLTVDVDSIAEDGSPVCRNEFTLFIRGLGNFSNWMKGGEVSVPRVKSSRNERQAAPAAGQLTRDIRTPENLALIYRLSGDLNPLHVDKQMAAMGGFKRPILHGLCSFGIATKAIVQVLLDNEPSNVHSVSGRFSAPVTPGDELRVQMWSGTTGANQRHDTKEIYFKVVNRSSADAVCLDHGIVTYTGENYHARM